jgi:FMN phosphatase YigB (HAD superfamily)
VSVRPEQLSSLPCTRLLDLIESGAVDLVTSDVFDTVVTRPVATPSDLFVELGRRLHDAGLLSPEVSARVFASARIAAEHSARRRVAVSPTDVGAAECTLEEIWAELPDRWFTTEQRAAALDAELGCEADLLIANTELTDVFGDAAQRAVPVVLVSDTYLSPEQLRQVLAGCGIDLSPIEAVVTSSAHRRGKAKGLLAEVIAARGVEPQRVVHIGDNERADLQTAIDLGAHAVATDLLRRERHLELPPPAIVAASEQLGTDGGVSAAIRSRLIADPTGTDPAVQFGAGIAGPLVSGFARWAALEAAELGASTVHCLLREGATIAELMQRVVPASSPPLRTRLLHASRWVYMRAAVIDATAEQIAPAIARRAALHPRHVAEAFDLDERRVANVLGTTEIPTHARGDALAAIAADDELRGQIVAAAARLRTRLHRYLEHALADDDPLVICDVGWGGTIQEGLTRVLRAGGDERRVVGLYLALSASGEFRIAQGYELRSYLANATTATAPGAERPGRSVAHNADIVERLLTPALGTLVDIDDAGAPVCRAERDDELVPSLQRAQAAMLDVAGRLAGDDGLDEALWVRSGVWRSALGTAMADVIGAPPPTVAATLGEWPHDDVAGTAAKAIANPDIVEFADYLNAAELDTITWPDATWLPGVLAGHNHSLLAQVDALRAGVPAAQLCPPSEAGPARVSVFEIDSLLAADEEARLPRVNARGWSIVRLPAAVRSLRSVRFDSGLLAAITDVGLLRIRLRLVDERVHELRISDLTDGQLVWVDARPLDARRFAHRAGGHLIVPIEAELGARVRRVEVDAAFRVWSLAEGEADVAAAATSVEQWLAALDATSADEVIARFAHDRPPLATQGRAAYGAELLRRGGRRARATVRQAVSRTREGRDTTT